jgi:RNA polymerase sigma-70 factor (ECF subfamily)
MENLDGYKDEELIAAFLEGDHTAFEELVRRYETQVFNLAYRILGDRTDALDVSQEVFILLFRKLGTFRSESRFSTWLYRVATNACRDYTRKKRYHLSLSSRADEDMPEWEEMIPGDEESPDDLLISAELQDRVRKAIRKLPIKFREVVYLHDIEGYNYKEISEILDISLGTVKSRLNRARHRLAQELRGLAEPKEKADTSKPVEEGIIDNTKGTSSDEAPRRNHRR